MDGLKELDALPAELFMLEELEVLDLSPEREACLRYRLPALPPAVGQLTNLRQVRPAASPRTRNVHKLLLYINITKRRLETAWGRSFLIAHCVSLSWLWTRTSLSIYLPSSAYYSR